MRCGDCKHFKKSDKFEYARTRDGWCYRNRNWATSYDNTTASVCPYFQERGNNGPKT